MKSKEIEALPLDVKLSEIHTEKLSLKVASLVLEQ